MLMRRFNMSCDEDSRGWSQHDQLDWIALIRVQLPHDQLDDMITLILISVATK